MIEHIWEVMSYAGAGAAGLIAKLVWDKIKGIERRADEIEQKSEVIEKNYIHRFEEVHNQLIFVKEEIVSKITDLRVSLAESYIKKADLPSRKVKSK